MAHIIILFQPDDIDVLKCHYDDPKDEYDTPYPTYMIINQYHKPTLADDQHHVINAQYRASVMSIPRSPDVIDLKLDLQPLKKKQKTKDKRETFLQFHN